MKFFTILSILTSLLWVGCNPAQNEEQQSYPDILNSGNWQLVEIRSMDDRQGTTRPENPTDYTMMLEADSTVSMRLNCNRATGTWSAAPSASGDNGTFEFGPLAVTKAKCPPPSLGEKIAVQTQYIRGYMLRADTLYLSLMADGGIWVWERVDGNDMPDIPLSPGEGGPRNFVIPAETTDLQLYTEPTVDSEVLVRYKTGIYLDNLGCSESEEKIWCYVQQMGGGPVGYVKYDSVTEAVGPNGSVPVGPDNSALRTGQGEFDASGMIPCKLKTGQPTISCEFRVARAGEGYATVVVTRPGDTDRVLFFRLGIPTGISSSEADRAGEFSYKKESDLNLIYVGQERYEIPDAVILGG